MKSKGLLTDWLIDEDEEDIYLGTDGFPDLWTELVKYGARLSNENIEISITDSVPTIEIGGYGLFS